MKSFNQRWFPYLVEGRSIK
uniref:Uncharacterized protein n=1 Tax=Lepeophtheirus salmonis TaxID=72036 RepID=A0A0K2TD41_LEPSM